MASIRPSKLDLSLNRTISSSITHRRQYQLDNFYIDRLDNIQVLGQVLGGDGSLADRIGHIGCVNALSWSPSGQLLASGSDDRNVILWKLGSDDSYPTNNPDSPGAHRRAPRHSPLPAAHQHESDTPSHTPSREANNHSDDIVQQWPQRSFPSLGLGMLGKIQTGHRANIFSVKWAPNASERRLLTCAGDNHVRVFDINYMSGFAGEGGSYADDSTILPNGQVCDTWSEHSGACIRLFRCHRGRAKRISTEVSPDVFLTCAEDGDVRQMDIRAPHTCRSRTGGSCPPPLAHYPSELYSLSVSKLEPWLFAVAGESSFAYLHDRRMVPRVVKRDWGMTNDMEQDALTMCVRKFGIPPGGFETPWVQHDGRTALVAEAPQPSKPRLLMGNRNSITACKLSEDNGRDLLVSYSSGHIYRFDIYGEPGVLQANLDKARFSMDDCSRSSEADQAPSGQDQTSSTDESKDVEKRGIEQHPCAHGQEENREPAITDDDNDADEEETVELFSTAGHHNEGKEDIFHFLEEEQAGERSTYAAEPIVPIVYPRSAYKGHCNKETVKDVAFAGRSDEYVISGSDDGNWFMWDKVTSDIKGIWHGDSSVVNVMAMHPDMPVFAISGIDDTIKIFAPITVTAFPPLTAKDQDEDVEENSKERVRKRPKTWRDATRACKIADRMADKDEICERNERRMHRDFVGPAANILWRLHPRLLGVDVSDDPERQIEGDCVVM
uniref:Wd40 repeat-like protein n=1 Tax=Melanopsichium pennsylvanicum 4 TaxID=1398559 RepID=A0A077QZ27_9BASI|nr:wd40 repeat-like protein [Melanopsichium pennsylvanicum 4]